MSSGLEERALDLESGRLQSEAWHCRFRCLESAPAALPHWTTSALPCRVQRDQNLPLQRGVTPLDS